MRVENEKIIGQIVGISEVYDQNGERVLKNHNCCHISSIRLKVLLAKYEKIWDLSMNVPLYIYSWFVSLKLPFAFVLEQL